MKNKFNRWQMLRMVLGRFGWCRTEQDWLLTRWQRYAYTAKAVVCIVLGRRGLSGRGAQIEVGQANHHERYMPSDGYTTAEWDVVLIGAGARCWRYKLDWDCT